jgi:hypothetical protein
VSLILLYILFFYFILFGLPYMASARPSRFRRVSLAEPQQRNNQVKTTSWSRNGRPTLRPMASTMACQRLLAVRDQLRNQQVLSDHGKGKLILRMA